MIQSSNERYTGNAYLQSNPGWNLEDASWKAAIIIGMMTKNNLSPVSITDIGCGAGGILKEISHSINRKLNLTGYDISPAAISMADKNNEGITFIQGNYVETDVPVPDLLLLIDVLEHVDDYYGFLRKLRAKTNHLILHVPLDLSVRSMLKPHIMKQQRDSVGHIHYFSQEMLFWSLKDSGFEIIDWRYTKPVSDVSVSPTLWRSVKKRFRNMTFRLFPALSAKLWGEYSVMVLAK